MPHGLAVDAEGGVWVTDLVRHQASLCPWLAQSSWTEELRKELVNLFFASNMVDSPQP